MKKKMLEFDFIILNIGKNFQGLPKNADLDQYSNIYHQLIGKNPHPFTLLSSILKTKEDVI